MIEKVFQSEIKLGTAQDRRTLLGLAKHSDMGSNAQLVYIFSLGVNEPLIPYPKEAGRVVYIGETKRQTGAGKRFGGHISPSLTEGLSTLTNHTLSVYYHMGKTLFLRVFKVTDGRRPAEAERVLLRAHLYKYGALPIAQGTSGRDNTPKEILRVYNEEQGLYDECIELLA